MLESYKILNEILGLDQISLISTGPVCYDKGGPLAVTDANLLLGRLLPQHFPQIFGPNEDQPLNAAATRLAFQKITEIVSRKPVGVIC